MTNARKAEDKKQELLDTGGLLLSQYGYNGVGLKEVLSTCNVPKGSFYHYFSSKEDYVAQVIAHYQSHYLGALDELIAAPGKSALEKIRTFSEGIIAFVDAADNKMGCLLGSMSAEVGGSNETVRQAVAEAYQQLQARYYPLFRQAQEAGEIRNDIPAEQLADIFWNQWQGALLRMQFEQSSAILKDSLDVMLQTLYQPN